MIAIAVLAVAASIPFLVIYAIVDGIADRAAAKKREAEWKAIDAEYQRMKPIYARQDAQALAKQTAEWAAYHKGVINSIADGTYKIEED